MGHVEDVPTGVTSICNDNYEPDRCGAALPGLTPTPAPTAATAPSATRPSKPKPTPRRAMRQVIKYSGKLKETLVHEVQGLRPSSKHREKSPLVARTSSDAAATAAQPRRSREELRQLWKKAINQQVLLNRMERENERITERVRSGERVMYAEMPPCAGDVKSEWRQLLDSWRAGRKVHVDDLQELVFRGVPIRLRPEVWQLLVFHHRLHHPAPSVSHVDNYDTSYLQLIRQLTSFQREILTDLGRTFPQHPYFRSPFGSGQLELFNVLKAVSLLDPELGYCQGLGFIAGILLLHAPEEESYELLKHMLFPLELRKQFMPDMSPLQIQMYQFSRLVHDHHSDLYAHLEKYEVSPMLYATPWFLTLFSSQYPIGFSARVFDLILLLGLEAVFKVSLALLDIHQEQLKNLTGMEDIMEYIKTEMPRLSQTSAQQVFRKAVELDISRQLLSYEVEYHVLQEEVLASPSHADSDLNKLGAMNQNLKRQVMELLHQLQTSSDQIKTLTERNKTLESRVSQLSSERSDLVTFVRYLSLHTPDRLEVPAPFRRFLDDGAASEPAGDARDPLNCALFEAGPSRPRRERALSRSKTVDCE
ncbi:TBC1 domain family member 1 [Amphibalanus amphitrite]|uniref:TBC1 domain family member 1 n=2 Tax=Amphibalanus amphitrite TaxID=1232801 RepID=A0A6A4VHH5_AMPAM|nr:TBC1 domain family member 4-like isoform X1 [Amphibalanus amphitrite]KAF0291004.1 TBC1 domain family member 1 [Amphibalanus amphitrite]